MTPETSPSTSPSDLVKRVLSSNIALALVLLAAALLRVAHVLSLRRLPLFDKLIVDSEAYDQWARLIASGNWLGGDRPFFMDPLYSYTLAVIYRFFGHDLLVVRLFQAGLGVAICALVAFIGRCVGGRAVGTVAALLVAFYRPLIFEGAEIEKTALGVFLVTAALAFGIQRPAGAKFGAGVFLALAALARGNLILMAPFGVLYFLCAPDADTAGSRPAGFAGNWRQRLTGKPALHAVTFLAGFLLTLSPVLWRNHHVSGEWILTTSSAGINFYTGNNPYSKSGGYEVVPFVRPLAGSEEEDFRAKAESITGKRMTPKEISSFWFHQALSHIAEHPRFAAQVFLRKIVLFWSNVEIPDGWSIYFLAQFSPALRLAPFNFGCLLALAVLGLFASFRSSAGVRLLSGYIAAYAASIIVFFVFSRFRMYIVPPLAVLAALGLRWIWDQAAQRDVRHALPGACTALCIGAFSFFGASAIGISPDRFVHNYSLLAELYEESGDYKTAEGLLYTALRKRPGSSGTLCALGELYLKAGYPERAIAYLEQSIQANDRSPNVWFLLGSAYESLGRIDEAVRCFRKQLEITPGNQPARQHLESLANRARR